MIVTKRFKKLQSAVAWMNSPENSGINVVTILPDDGEIAVIYSIQETAANLSLKRRETLRQKIEDHINYPEATKKKMGYPKDVIAANGVPCSRLYNSLRNLAVFRGVDVHRAIRETVADCGFELYIARGNVLYVARGNDSAHLPGPL